MNLRSCAFISPAVFQTSFIASIVLGVFRKPYLRLLRPLPLSCSLASINVRIPWLDYLRCISACMEFSVSLHRSSSSFHLLTASVVLPFLSLLTTASGISSVNETFVSRCFRAPIEFFIPRTKFSDFCRMSGFSKVIFDCRLSLLVKIL